MLSSIPLVQSIITVFITATVAALPPPNSQAETWTIPRMKMHIMSPTTGIPGNPPWPDSRRFNSTIDFAVLMPGDV
jgi:hypothetical protein